MKHVYRLDRVVIWDHAGTPREEVLFTTNREELLRAIEESMTLGGFRQDNLQVAWRDALIREGELDGYEPATLRMAHDAAARPLYPDMTVRRGAFEAAVRVDYVDDSPTFTIDGRSEAKLGAAAETVLAAGRSEEGDVEVTLELERLFASIPPLSEPIRTEPVRVVPFFDNEEFREYWDEEGEFRDMGDVDEFDGYIPMDRWFNLGELEELCEDVGAELELK